MFRLPKITGEMEAQFFPTDDKPLFVTSFQ